jgi:hypothetical protein
MNDRHHYDVGVVQVEGRCFVRMRRQIGSLIDEGSPVLVPAHP